MTDKNAINIISGLLQQSSPTNGSDVADIINKYPYFVPARYIKAADDHHKKAFSADMLSSAYPYTANWLQFLDYVQGARKAVVHKIAEPKVAAIVPKEEAQIVSMPEVSATIEEIAPIEEEEIVAMPEQVTIEDVTEVMETHVPEPVVDEEPKPIIVNTEAEQPIGKGATPQAEIEEMQAETVHGTHEEGAIEVAEVKPVESVKKEEAVFTPFQSDDYFMQQGIKISRDMPDNIDEFKVPYEEPTTAKALMVMMSFTEWLMHFKSSAQKQQEEEQDQKAIRTMWQKEKLAAAMEEENEEIPENVFEMAVNSIAKEEGLASESLADIYEKQGRHEQAIEMYKKLSLRNPQKNAYFARKIEDILKENRL